MNLPTRGLCHSVFLLAQSARVKRRKSIEEWIEAARRAPTIMASALAVDSVAEFLVSQRLAGIDEDGVSIDEDLVNAGAEACTETFAAIARIILHAKPPSWVSSAVIDGIVCSELIPTSDERALEWLEDLRDPLLIDIKKSNDQAGHFRAWLGAVGESLVVTSERQSGRSVTQVSRISDSIGFDIDSLGPGGRRCIEVKTSLESTAERFFISRNETSKALSLGVNWYLVQIILRSNTATDDQITPAHVVGSRLLKASDLLQMLPSDTITGVWMDSARIMPPKEAWGAWNLVPNLVWRVPGYRSPSR